ncbi:MAG: septal ring lytic transglycosylase RlpA family protein [Patescibacteria group bacterium]
MTRAKNKIIFGIALASLFFISNETLAADTSLYLDADTVAKGYTVNFADSQFSVGVVAGLYEGALTANLNELESFPALPKDTTAVSNVYQYSFSGVQTSDLQYPVNVAVNYESENLTPKHLYYYNEEKNSWQKIDSKSSDTKIKGQITAVSAKLIVLEKRAYRVRLDRATLEKGYTVANDEDSNFKVGVNSNTIDQPATIVFKIDSQENAQFPDGLEQASDIYSFELKTAKPIVFAKPVILNMRLTEPDDHKKEMYYYDGNKGAWIPLPSKTSPGGDEVRAFIHLKYAKVVVLRNSNYMETGYASWYQSSKYPNGAASNDYPYDTILRVTNLANGKWVDVTVVSTGPFVAGRIIDLTSKAFGTIASLYMDGVIRVRVEEL